jgi:hypothetical protein
MSFADFMDDHSNGTYASLRLAKDDLYTVKKFLARHNVTNYDDPADFHCTVCYSRKPVPNVRYYQLDTPVMARVDKWEVFPTQKGGKCLVMKLEAPNIVNIHNDIKQLYGATHDYPEFKPHVTVCYGWDKDSLPNLIQENFWLLFDEFRVKGIDPDWKPGK